MNSIRLIKPFLIEKRLTILSGIVCLIIVDFLQLCIPRIVKWVVDDLTALRIETKQLMIHALTIFLIGCLIGFFRFFWRRCLIGTSRRVEEGLRNRLFEHIQTLSAPYFDRIKTGDVMAHATNDIQHIRMATGMGMVALTDAIVLGTAAIGFMLYINVQLTLFVLIPMPMIIFGTRFFSKIMHQRYQEVQASFADLTEVVRESFAGIRIVKAYNRQTAIANKLKANSEHYVSCNLKLVRITGSFFPMMLLFSNLSLAIVLYLGGLKTISTTITAGDFVAFISYLGLLTWPMMALGWVTNLIQRGKASLDRIDSILKTRPEIVEPVQPIHLPKTRGALSFDRVTFSYASRSTPALDNISFELPAGQTLGIIGPPGSGKTTLLNLIPRLYDIEQGCIRLDGVDIRDILTKELRQRISFVPQEPYLFAETIRTNLTFNDPRMDDEKISKAADAAALLETVTAFPDGFESRVGEKGIVLSGGQKQRIAIARALLKKTPLLILDDPISQVDIHTGMNIIDRLRTLPHQPTMIIVSHRMSAVRFAHQVITLDQGKITEAGTHEDLIRRSGYYARSFHLQVLEEELHAH